MNAAAVAYSTGRHGKRTLRAYRHADVPVPNIALNLLVPRISDGACCGSVANKPGNWINPPPPTAASTSPATNAMHSSHGNSVGINSSKATLRTTGATA
ncbi:hypothetical protein XOCgx_4766 [Xanthomonas oryzae pv. oryzicola]|nr:hypothetical protein XOCgx_4766 [Xanthomonas oryzae pv. oryzicola]